MFKGVVETEVDFVGLKTDEDALGGVKLHGVILGVKLGVKLHGVVDDVGVKESSGVAGADPGVEVDVEVDVDVADVVDVSSAAPIEGRFLQSRLNEVVRFNGE